MSTRSAIGYKAADGKVVTIYCHYDGYPKHVGKILKEFHSSDEALHTLINGSHIRNFDNDGTVVRFGDGTSMEVSDNEIEAIYGYDYLYLWSFAEQKWTCLSRDGFVKPDALMEINL